jgi:nucleotide-binding universal stress UspA family protein
VRRLEAEKGERLNRQIRVPSSIDTSCTKTGPGLLISFRSGSAIAATSCVNSQLTESEKARDEARILCPVDFDVNSLAALDLSRELARQTGATLYALHVVLSQGASNIPLTSYGAPEHHAPSAALFRSYRSFLVEHTPHFYLPHVRIDELVRQSLTGMNYRLIMRIGKPAEAIVEVATEVKAGVLIMATHRRTDESRHGLGSTAEAVIREAPCPVLTIRHASKSDARAVGALIVRGAAVTHERNEVRTMQNK